MRSMSEVERVLAEVNVPQNIRQTWINLYRGYLRNTTPPGKREELYPLPKIEETAREAAAATGERAREDALDYVVEG